MKNKSIITIACLIFCNIIFINAQQESPIEISPFIGEKLDRVERDYFYLFPTLEGFQQAEFYLNPDSTLTVEIVYEVDGVSRDTVLNNYKSPQRIKNQIDQYLTYIINDIESNFRGQYTDVLLCDSSKVSGELLLVRQNSILINCNSRKSHDEKERVSLNLDHISENNIKNISFKSNTNLSLIIFPVLGAGIGAIIGSNLGTPDPEDTFWEKFFDISIDNEKVLGTIGGFFIGAAAGILLGFLIPIEAEFENIYEAPFNETDIEGLRDRSKYKDEEPYFLTKII